MTSRRKVEVDGKVFRYRRGKLVEIPPEWVGKTVGRQTINKRASKALHKHRKMVKYGAYRTRAQRIERDRAKDEP